MSEPPLREAECGGEFGPVAPAVAAVRGAAEGSAPPRSTAAPTRAPGADADAGGARWHRRGDEPPPYFSDAAIRLASTAWAPLGQSRA